MRDDATGLLVGLTTGHSLNDIEVVLHLVEAAIVRQSIKKRANSVFCRHQEHRVQKMAPEYELSGRNSTSIDSCLDRQAYRLSRLTSALSRAACRHELTGTRRRLQRMLGCSGARPASGRRATPFQNAYRPRFMFAFTAAT